MRYFFLLVVTCITLINKVEAQQYVSRELGFMILKSNESLYPKFNRELNNILDTEVRLKSVKFIRGNKKGSPAFASLYEGSITFDISFIEAPDANYDDNRFVVVLYHELGHLYDNVSSTAAEKEEQAFRFSLMKLRKLSESGGDCGPLETGIKFMRLRSKSGNVEDPHTIALKKIVSSALFLEYDEFVKNGCKETQEVINAKANREERIRNMINEFRVERKPLLRTDFFFHSHTPKSEKSFFLIYISKRDDGQIVLRLRIQYEGTKPLSVNRYLIKTDTREIIISPPNQIIKGVKSFTYYSYCDFPVNRYIFKAISDIVNSTEPELTYFGSLGNDSRKLKEKEIDAIKKTLIFFELMGGSVDFAD